MLCGGPHVMTDRSIHLTFHAYVIFFLKACCSSLNLLFLEVKASMHIAGFNPPNDQSVALKYHV